jgi:hypothetical protein
MNRMDVKSVKSINLWQSIPDRHAGVILTIYDIVKTDGGKIKILSEVDNGYEFIVFLLNTGNFKYSRDHDPNY